MQNTFEQLNKSLDSLNLILKEEIALTQIEKDIVLEKLRKLYLQLYTVSATESSENNISNASNIEGDQDVVENVDSLMESGEETNEKANAEAERLKAEEEQRRKAEEQRRLQEEEAKRKAEAERLRIEEEQRRKAEEQRRLQEEEAKRKAEAERLRIEEEQRRKAEEQHRLQEEEAKRKAEAERLRTEEEQRRKAEEQRRLQEEEAKRKAEAERLRIEEEQRRKAEEQQRHVHDEDDLLQFRPQSEPTKPIQRSLNDLFTDNRVDNSIGAQFQKAKVSDLTKAISINEKFTFIKELFNNRGEEFSAAINTLNQCTSLDDAFNCLENYKKKFFWDSTSTAYLSLCDLLRRKFM